MLLLIAAISSLLLLRLFRSIFQMNPHWRWKDIVSPVPCTRDMARALTGGTLHPARTPADIDEVSRFLALVPY
jgi:hypothetical protein